MVLTDTSAADRSIRLGAGTQVVAVGGDILFDTRPRPPPLQLAAPMCKSRQPQRGRRPGERLH